MAMKVSHEYIHAVHLSDARPHAHTNTNHHASLLQMKLFFCLGPPLKIVPIWDATTVHDEYIHSQLQWELCSRASLTDIFYLIVWRLCCIDFPILLQRDINVYYYYCFTFPLAICVSAHQLQFAFNEWSQGMRCSGVKRGTFARFFTVWVGIRIL